MGAANEMVDLIKKIIREEEEKKDQIITATVLTRNDANDTYDVYIDSELSPSGRQAVMKGIPNESKHIYRPGDHVYVMKVRGQVAQGFIIGSIGNMGVSINAKVKDLENELSGLRTAVTPAMMLVAPDMQIETFRYKANASDSDSNAVFGIRLTWAGGTIPSTSFYILTNLTVGGVSYPNGRIAINTYVAMATVPTETNLIRVAGATNVFDSSTVSKVPIVGGSVSTMNEQQRIEIAFMNDGTPILFDNVSVGSLSVNVTRGFSSMPSGYKFEI